MREIALIRKARGGKPMGLWENRDKLKKVGKDDFKQQMLNAEKLLAYDPGSTDHMAATAVAAQKGSYLRGRPLDRPRLFRPPLLAQARLQQADRPEGRLQELARVQEGGRGL